MTLFCDFIFLLLTYFELTEDAFDKMELEELLTDGFYSSYLLYY